MKMVCKFDYFLVLRIHNNIGEPIMDHFMSWITYSGDAPLIFLYLIATGIIDVCQASCRLFLKRLLKFAAKSPHGFRRVIEAHSHP